MEDLNDVLSRMKHRRAAVNNDYDSDYKSESIKTKKQTKSSSLYRLMMVTLFLCVLLVGGLIVVKDDDNCEKINKTFGTNFNFTAINTNLNGFVSSLLNFDVFNLFGNTDKPVQSSPNYLLNGTDTYTNASGMVEVVDGGQVIFVEKNPDNTYLIIVSHDCGINASYMNVSEKMVKLYDRVELKDSIGLYQNSIKIIFHKNNKKISYEDVKNYTKAD